MGRKKAVQPKAKPEQPDATKPEPTKKADQPKPIRVVPTKKPVDDLTRFKESMGQIKPSSPLDEMGVLDGDFMIALWILQDGKITLHRKTNRFPIADIPVALKLLQDDLKTLKT